MVKIRWFGNSISSTENKRRNNDKQDASSECKESFTYEEALDETGTGRYNKALAVVMTLSFIACGLDMFGFTVVITGCSCEFGLSMAQKSILNSMPFAGALMVSYIWGYISDTQGRRKSLLIAMSGSCLVSILSSLSPNWIMLAALKFISSSFSSCAQSATFVLLGESCSQRVRGTYMLLMTAFFILNFTYSYVPGYYILKLDFAFNLGLLGHFSPWRLVTLVNALPLGLVALLLLAFYESPKFLANKGMMVEALSVLKMIWIRNGGDPEMFRVKNLTLEDLDASNRRDIPLLQSIWQHTVPLFKPPYLLRSLQLYYLNAVIFSIANGFLMWFPLITDAFYSSLKSSNGGNEGLCELMVTGHNKRALTANTTGDMISCSSRLEQNTFISGCAYTGLFFFIFLMLSQAYSRKKTVLIGLLLTSTIASATATLTPEPVSAITLYVFTMVMMVGSGITAAYFVELFPTSYRGMASCLGMVVARVMGLAGINMIGAFALSHCHATFFGSSLFCLSGVIVACFLPSNKPDKVNTKSPDEES